MGESCALMRQLCVGSWMGPVTRKTSLWLEAWCFYPRSPHSLEKGQSAGNRGKDPDAGKDWRQKKKTEAEDEMVGQHQWLSEHEFEQTPEDGEGQGSLRCWVHGVTKSRTRLWSNQSIRKEINPEYSLEGLMLKLQYFGYLMQRARKDPEAGKDWRQKEETTEDQMVGWHYWLNRYEFEQALEDSGGQGGLVCCSPWGCKESDMTEWLNWLTDL